MKDLIKKVIKAFFTSLAVTAGAIAVCFLILYATGNRLSWNLRNILAAAGVVVLLPDRPGYPRPSRRSSEPGR